MSGFSLEQTETDYHVAGGNLDLAAQLQQWPGAATGELGMMHGTKSSFGAGHTF